MDDTLRARVHKLQARRSETLLEIGKLQDRRQLTMKTISPDKIGALCEGLKARLIDPPCSEKLTCDSSSMRFA